MIEATHMISYLITDAEANVVGNAHNIADFNYGSVQVEGITNADVQLEISNNGEDWEDLGAAIAADTIDEIDLYTIYIRAEVENYVDGTINVILCSKR